MRDLQSVKKCLAKDKKISEVGQDQKMLIFTFCISFGRYCLHPILRFSHFQIPEDLKSCCCSKNCETSHILDLLDQISSTALLGTN